MSSWLALTFGTMAFAQASLLQAGPMVGYVEMTEAAIWVQTKRPAKVQVIAVLPDNSNRQSATVQTTEAGDRIAMISLTGLPFDTAIRYMVLINGEDISVDRPLSFRTQPHWRWTTGQNTPEFTFAFGSCAYFNDIPFDRPGTPYGGPTEIFRTIAAQRPNFMMWLGDNDYYREPDWLTEAAMRYRFAKGRSHPDLQPLLSSVPNYAIWDDHDYGPNDSDRSFRLKEQALKIFRDYWPAVQYGTAETKGVFQRFEWMDCEFFMLDDRYHRSPNNAPENAEKVMLGKAQAQWLKDALLNSKASFKFIVNGGQMINDNNFECFSKFPAERDDLFQFIGANKIEGVVFLSGDRHTTELLKTTGWGIPYPLYEYTSSPLTSGVPAQATGDPLGVPGTFVKARNFGMIRVSGPRGNRIATLWAMDASGNKLWEQTIRQEELRAPR
jgi:alkaline phosphatase D